MRSDFVEMHLTLCGLFNTPHADSILKSRCRRELTFQFVLSTRQNVGKILCVSVYFEFIKCWTIFCLQYLFIPHMVWWRLSWNKGNDCAFVVIFGHCVVYNTQNNVILCSLKKQCSDWDWTSIITGQAFCTLTRTGLSPFFCWYERARYWSAGGGDGGRYRVEAHRQTEAQTDRARIKTRGRSTARGKITIYLKCNC